MARMGVNACPPGSTVPDPRRHSPACGEARHLSRVCRLAAGDEVEVFDGRGGATRAKVMGLGADWVDLVAVGGPIPDHAPPFPLVLASAVPKADLTGW